MCDFLTFSAFFIYSFPYFDIFGIYRKQLHIPYLINNKIYFFEYKEQDIETAFRYRAFSRTTKILADKSIRFYLHRENPCSNVHTWKPLTVNCIKAKVYSELIKETSNKYLKQDRGYLKYVILGCLYEFFNYMGSYGYSKNQIEQVNYMIALNKELKFSLTDYWTLSKRNKIKFFTVRLKVRKLLKEKILNKMDFVEKSSAIKKDLFIKDCSSKILERWKQIIL